MLKDDERHGTRNSMDHAPNDYQNDSNDVIYHPVMLSKSAKALKANMKNIY